MVQGISSNPGVAYQPQVANNNIPANPQGPKMPSQAEMDEFVTALEAQHKKAIVKKNCIGGLVAGASTLALLGGTFLKSKWGRALSVAPVALTTLFFGVSTLLKGNKVPDYKALFNNPDAAAHAHQA